MSTSRKIAAFVPGERSLRRALLVASAATLLAALLLPISPVEAKKPKKDKFGCTEANVTSDFGKKCIDKNIALHASGRPVRRVWTVVCFLGGVQCCMADSTSIDPNSCTSTLSSAPTLNPKGDKSPRCKPGVACIPPAGSPPPAKIN